MPSSMSPTSSTSPQAHGPQHPPWWPPSVRAAEKHDCTKLGCDSIRREKREESGSLDDLRRATELWQLDRRLASVGTPEVATTPRGPKPLTATQKLEVEVQRLESRQRRVEELEKVVERQQHEIREDDERVHGLEERIQELEKEREVQQRRTQALEKRVEMLGAKDAIVDAIRRDLDERERRYMDKLEDVAGQTLDGIREQSSFREESCEARLTKLEGDVPGIEQRLARLEWGAPHTEERLSKLEDGFYRMGNEENEEDGWYVDGGEEYVAEEDDWTLEEEDASAGRDDRETPVATELSQGTPVSEHDGAAPW